LKGYDMKKLLTSAMLVLASQAYAQDWHVQVHGLSYHQVRTQPNGVKWNELNWGLGLRYQATESLDVQAGMFRNSQYRDSTYAIATWLPLGVTEAVRVGAFAGAVNGYRLRDGKPVAAGGLAARWQGERFSVTARLLPKHPKSDTGAMTLELGIKL
jgi:hypothetical protein